jgi:integrase
VGQTFAGPHDTAPKDEVLVMVQKLPDWPTNQYSNSRLLEGSSWVLDWLLTFPGEGWRDRWVAAGADTSPLGWLAERHGDDHRDPKTVHKIAVEGMRTLVVSRVLLPGYEFFSTWKTKGYQQIINQQDPALVAQMVAFADQIEMSQRKLREVWPILGKIMLHTGKDLPALTAEDIFELRAHYREKAGVSAQGLGPTWTLLAGVGILPKDSSLRAALRVGQRTPAELIDRYGIAAGPVRDLLVRYLEERKSSVDYTTIKSLARMLAGNFWADLERHHPGLASTDSLALRKEMVTAWKERVAVIVAPDGSTRPRRDFLDLLMTVRCFYLDVRDWALHDASLAPWVVASPITRADVAGNAKRKLSHQARIHQRIRERVPLVPRMLARLEQERREAEQMLSLAKQTPTEVTFTFNGRSYQRISTRARVGRGLPSELAYDVVCLETGKRSSVGRIEEDAFWLWAIVETLRHTGVRLEELLELTHLALVSHRLSTTGELVPLLQIVPSKTNEERLLLVTPELARVLAEVISRLRNRYGGAVPLVARYDNYEATTGPRLPHLFQRDYGSGPAVTSPTMVRVTLREVAQRMGLADASGNPVYLTPHDFRRVFTTTAVQDGLPLHIASKILGHRHLNSTQPYTAVFQDDLIRTYRTFVDRRRSARPVEEYREPTDAEWDEFEEHFALRSVELGSCARPYGSSCEHEHACIRCPMLRVDPAQLERLADIAVSLEERIAEAEARGWAGEVEQLKISLQSARDKILATAPQRIGTVLLGYPRSSGRG